MTKRQAAARSSTQGSGAARNTASNVATLTRHVMYCRNVRRGSNSGTTHNTIHVQQLQFTHKLHTLYNRIKAVLRPWQDTRRSVLKIWAQSYGHGNTHTSRTDLDALLVRPYPAVNPVGSLVDIQESSNPCGGQNNRQCWIIDWYIELTQVDGQKKSLRQPQAPTRTTALCMLLKK